MSVNTAKKFTGLSGFCEGIKYLGEPWADYDKYAFAAVIAEGQSAIAKVDDAAVYQTLLAAA